MSRYLLCIALALFTVTPSRAQPAEQAPAAAAPQAAPDSEGWLVSDTQIASVHARVAFPRDAGILRAYRHQEFSHQGEAIDNGVQYRSADGAIFGTVYVYYPGLPHSGLAAYATDRAIRRNSDSPVSGGDARVVAAGGVEGIAIRADYGGYRGGLVSSAAFVKAGRWIVKFRVSGPEARRAEVDAAMTALLAGARFGPASPTHPAAPLSIRDCPAGAGAHDANPLPDPPGAEIAAHAFLATFDGGGIEATDETTGARHDLPPRVPPTFCLASQPQTRLGPVPILRGEEGPPISIDGRTVLVAVLNDAGALLELVHAENLRRYLLLHHDIGSTVLLGGFDSIPSDRQIVEIIEHPDAGAARPRVPVRFRPNQGPQMFLPELHEGNAPVSAPPRGGTR